MSRYPYGSGGTPTNLAGVNARTSPRVHGLRSANAIYGWYADKGGKRVHRRPKNLNPTANLVEAVTEDAPIRKYVRSVTPVTDYANERRIASQINNVQSYN